MLNKKEKQVVLVSGVTSGMGLKFIELIQKNGYLVIPIVRNKELLDNVENYETIIEYDYSEPWNVDKAFKNLNVKIDIFVNFAAILPGLSLFEQSYEGLKNIFNVNTISPMLIVKRIQHQFKKNGCIILLGSISAQKGSFDDPYSASKGAIHSLVKSLSLKFSPNIRVVGVAPGITNDTKMTRDLIEGLYEKNIKKVPLGKAGEAEDIAKLILFLMGNNASFITGCIIDVNGGQYLR
jgi:NAD(P)-dependent dehydrogenase (short-subunit alcohol dehydrogenase family)